MLHMALINHGPDTCAGAHPEIGELMQTGMGKMDEVASRLGITIQGSWVNMAAHAIYMLVDAPNAHVVSDLARETQLMDWNTVVVSPVVTLEEAAALVSAG